MQKQYLLFYFLIQAQDNKKRRNLFRRFPLKKSNY